MRRITIFSLAAALGACSATGLAQTIEIGPIINPANGHKYYRLSSSTWTAAEAKAQTLGGHLVTIDDAAENEWVRANMAPNLRPWIGLWDPNGTNNFVWVSGIPVTYTAWNPGEPNNIGTERWVEMVNTTTPNTAAWNNLGNSPTFGERGVVEVEPFFIDWFTIDCGGGTTSDGDLQVSGTIGQFDAGGPFTDASGRFTITGGFWYGVEPICSQCIADYNGDGGIDGSDVSAFFAEWEGGTGCADVNHDGGIDGSDVSFFFGKWESGAC